MVAGRVLRGNIVCAYPVFILFPRHFAFAHCWREELDGPLAWPSVAALLFLCSRIVKELESLWWVLRSLAQAAGQTMLIVVPLLSQTQRDLADNLRCFAHNMLNRLGRKVSVFPKNNRALHQDGSSVGTANYCFLQPGCSSFRLWKGGSSSFLSNRTCFGLAFRVLCCSDCLESFSGAFPSPL